MATEYVSPAQKGMAINAELVYLKSLLNDPKLGFTSAQMLEIAHRVETAQQLINEIAGTRLNTENSIVGSIADSSTVSLIHKAMLELQAIAGRKLGDKFDRVEVANGGRIRNIVIGKPYRLLAKAYTLRGDVYLLGLSDQGHYAFSDASNWQEMSDDS